VSSSFAAERVAELRIVCAKLAAAPGPLRAVAANIARIADVLKQGAAKT
jgi:hypothetical protein